MAQPGNGFGMKGTASERAEKKVNGLAKKLNLSDDQKTKLLPLVIANEEKADKSMAAGEKRRQVRINLAEDNDHSVRSVLKPDQVPVYEQLVKERKEKMKERLQERMTEEGF